MAPTPPSSQQRRLWSCLGIAIALPIAVALGCQTGLRAAARRFRSFGTALAPIAAEPAEDVDRDTVRVSVDWRQLDPIAAREFEQAAAAQLARRHGWKPSHDSVPQYEVSLHALDPEHDRALIRSLEEQGSLTSVPQVLLGAPAAELRNPIYFAVELRQRGVTPEAFARAMQADTGRNIGAGEQPDAEYDADRQVVVQRRFCAVAGSSWLQKASVDWLLAGLEVWPTSSSEYEEVADLALAAEQRRQQQRLDELTARVAACEAAGAKLAACDDYEQLIADLDRTLVDFRAQTSARMDDPLLDLRRRALEVLRRAEAPDVDASSDWTARFLQLRGPDQVLRGEKFAVQLQVSRGTTVSIDAALEQLLAEDNGRSVPLTVVLAAPGCTLLSDARSIVAVDADAESRPIEWQLAIPLGAAVDAAELQVQVFCASRLLATLSRRVGSHPRPFVTEAPRTTGWAIAERGARRAADLTLIVHSSGPRQVFTILSPEFAVPRQEELDNGAERAWAQEQVVRQWHLARGRPADAGKPDPQAARDRLRGLGQALWERLAPPKFAAAYAELQTQLGADFRSICIYTDDPQVPWEWMAPPAAEPNGARNFLCASHRMGRWHLSHATERRPRPASQLHLDTIAVMAPSYTGEQQLPAQQREQRLLAGLPGYVAVDGTMAGLRALLADLPHGVVHFAGHGRVTEASGAATFAMSLQDADVDPLTWRGLAAPANDSGTLFFLNACEMARTAKVAAFVDGWAPALMELGVCGCIAPLCPVDDQGAADFAARFYRGAFPENGTEPPPVAELLRQARADLLEHGDITGMMFVFYGDPDLRLVRR